MGTRGFQPGGNAGVGTRGWEAAGCALQGVWEIAEWDAPCTIAALQRVMSDDTHSSAPLPRGPSAQGVQGQGLCRIEQN